MDGHMAEVWRGGGGAVEEIEEAFLRLRPPRLYLF